MITEEKRLLRMFYLLSDTNTYRKANELARQLQVSERTVKKDAEQLKELARKNGCRLDAVRGKGYALKVEDAICFQQAKESLDILFSNTEKGDKENPVYRIARAVMIGETADNDGYFRLEELAGALYISESDIKKKMSGVREFLESFNLTLRSRPGKGLKLEGDELSQRLCLLELYENHFRKRVVTFQDQKYEEAFADREDKEQIRNTVLWIIRKSPVKMFDSYLNRLINYILLMRNRMKSDLRIRGTDGKWSRYREEIFQSAEYTLAVTIIKAMEEYAEFEQDKEEAAALCVLLQMWSDIEATDKPEEHFPERYRHAQQVSKELIQALSEKWNLPFLQIDDRFSETLSPWLLRLFIQAGYGYSHSKNIGNLVSDNTIKDSVLSLAMADETAQWIKNKWNISVNEYNIQLLAVRFFGLFHKISYTYIPRRLLICARNGKESARIIAESLTKRFGTEWLETLEVSELYEGRKYPLEEYDCLIGSFQAYAYRYQWPYVEVSQILAPEDYDRIRQEVFLNGYDLDRVRQMCQWDTVWVHQDFTSSHMEGLLQLIAYQWGGDPKNKEQLAEYLEHREFHRIHSHILTLLTPASQVGKRVFEIYFLKKQICYLEKTVKAVVFVAVDFGNNPQIARYLEQILRSISKNLETLRGEADSEQILDILTDMARKEL